MWIKISFFFFFLLHTNTFLLWVYHRGFVVLSFKSADFCLNIHLQSFSIVLKFRSRFLFLCLCVQGWSAVSGGGDGSSGCSLPVRGHPDSPHMASAAGRGRGRLPGAGRRPGRPLSLPLQARHQLEDHPLVSPTVGSSHHSCCWLMLVDVLGLYWLNPKCFGVVLFRKSWFRSHSYLIDGWNFRFVDLNWIVWRHRFVLCMGVNVVVVGSVSEGWLF